MQPASTGSSRFFQKCGPHRLSAVADAAGALTSNDTDVSQDRLYDGVAPLQTAGPNQISFLDNRRYAPMLETTRAGAVIVHPDMRSRVPAGAAAIVTREPYTAWAKVAALFHPAPPVSPGIHPLSVVDPSAIIDPSAEIGPFCVIGPDAEIGPRCRIGASATIGQGVVMGPDCRIGTHASVSHAILGARVYVYPGARIGQEGFGFAVTDTGFITVPQLGRVLLHDDVEIGANSTVDRGSAGDTVIGAGSRLDNLVQIGHNVILGRCCIIVAQVGISGSTVLGDFVQVGGQAAMAGHLQIGAGAQIGAQAGVISDVDPGSKMLGSPAQSSRDFFRQISTLKKLSARREKPSD